MLIELPLFFARHERLPVVIPNVGEQRDAVDNFLVESQRYGIALLIGFGPGIQPEIPFIAGK